METSINLESLTLTLDDSSMNIPLNLQTPLMADVNRSLEVEIKTLKKQVAYLKNELSQKLLLIDTLKDDLHINSDTDDNDSVSFNLSSSSRLDTCDDSRVIGCNDEKACTGLLDFHPVGDNHDEYRDSEDSRKYENVSKELHRLREDCSGLAKFVYDELSLIKRKIGLENDEILEQPSSPEETPKPTPYDRENKSKEGAFEQFITAENQLDDEIIEMLSKIPDDVI